MTEPKRARRQRRAFSDDRKVNVKKAASPTFVRTPSTTAASTKIDLFILRHGEAGNRMSVVKEDSERPLTLEGRIEMQKIAKSLKAVGLQTDRICTSPLRRARETAEIAAKVLKIPRLEEWDELKPDGSKAELYRKLAKLEQDSRPILVGHEPYLSSMIGEIIGTTGARLVLKKGGLGKVRITSFTPRISGELRWLLTPKMITKMS
ncbi:phosphohistidine phosphatase SixA [Candidatus Bathyarchaeota archaeon]|nr:MAG: phosphohistidine phosphatase SixA [Candidatus Bathyarchaeota archaeon]